MKYSKTTLMELSHKYRSILKRCAFLNAAILLSAAIAFPAGATSYTADDLEGIYSVVGNTFGKTIDGNVDLTLAGTKEAPITISGSDWMGGVYGNASLFVPYHSAVVTGYYTSSRANS